MNKLNKAILADKRIRVIIGHYGSGKTEFSVNYAMQLAALSQNKVALADLDVVNPYFRSRERHEVMEDKGILVISSLMGNNINFELPSVDGAVLTPLQNHAYDVILDVGGDAVGARALARFKEYLVDGDYDMLAVVNANRPDTQTEDGIIMHVKAIESTVGVKVTGLINNTHLLRETTPEDVLGPQAMIESAGARMGITVRYIAAIRNITEDIAKQTEVPVVPVDMYMRDPWM